MERDIVCNVVGKKEEEKKGKLLKTIKRDSAKDKKIR